MEALLHCVLLLTCSSLLREEDQKFQATDTAHRRAESQRKAEERAKDEGERLRRAAAEQRAEQVRGEGGAGSSGREGGGGEGVYVGLRRSTWQSRFVYEWGG